MLIASLWLMPVTDGTVTLFFSGSWPCDTVMVTVPPFSSLPPLGALRHDDAFAVFIAIVARFDLHGEPGAFQLGFCACLVGPDYV